MSFCSSYVPNFPEYNPFTGCDGKPHSDKFLEERLVEAIEKEEYRDAAMYKAELERRQAAEPDEQPDKALLREVRKCFPYGVKGLHFIKSEFEYDLVFPEGEDSRNEIKEIEVTFAISLSDFDSHAWGILKNAAIASKCGLNTIQPEYGKSCFSDEDIAKVGLSPTNLVKVIFYKYPNQD